MTTPALYRRILRRETHSSRSGLAIGLAILLVAVFAWVGVESVLAVLAQPALLVAPIDAFDAVVGVPENVAPAVIIASGALMAVVGLVLMLVAVLPGRRARHTAAVDRTAVVVDDTAIASALARTASHHANIDPDQVVVSVGRRTAEVFVRPTSGFSVDKAEIVDAVQQQLDAFSLTPSLRSTVTIERKGIVGA